MYLLLDLVISAFINVLIVNYKVNHVLKLPLTALESGEKQAHIKACPREEKLEVLSTEEQKSADVALSIRQLVVRRGLSVLLMFIILATGVVISELLIRHLELDE